MKNQQINKGYFKYLFESNRSALIILGIISLILITFLGCSIFLGISGLDKEVFYVVRFMSAFVGMGLSMLTTIYLTKYLYRKESADLYFSLPMKRSTLWTTQFVFTYLVNVVIVSVPYLLSLLIFIIFKAGLALEEQFLFLLVLWIMMFIYQSLMHLICSKVNNLIDCILACFAYTFIPCAIQIATMTFFSMHIEFAMIGSGFELSEVLFYDYIAQITNLVIPCFTYIGNAYDYISLCYVGFIWWILVGVLSFLWARKSFITRKGEDSGQITTHFLIYPAIIVMIAYCMLINIDILNFSVLSLIGIVFGFTILMLLTFFSKRKVTFELKLVGFFALILGLSVTFGFAFDKTKGFGSLHEIPQATFDEFVLDYYYFDDMNDKNVLLMFENPEQANTYGKEIHEMLIKYAEKSQSSENMEFNLFPDMDLFYVDSTIVNVYYEKANDLHAKYRCYELDMDLLKDFEVELEAYLSGIETNEYIYQVNEY